jgi:hypothetical protein
MSFLVVFGEVVLEVGFGAPADLATVDGPDVLLAPFSDGVEFGVQFVVGVESGLGNGPVEDGLLDGATALGVVSAVAESAAGGDLGQVGEGVVEPDVGEPEVELAEAGRVDDEAALGKEDQFAGRGGVAALGIGFADGEGGLDPFAVDAVDEGRLADAGGAEDDGGRAGKQEFADAGKGTAGSGADGEDRMFAGDGLDFGNVGFDVVAEVGLVEEDDRSGAALVDHDEEALDAAEVQGFVEGLNNEGDVDVGGEDLAGSGAAGDLAVEG